MSEVSDEFVVSSVRLIAVVDSSFVSFAVFAFSA